MKTVIKFAMALVVSLATTGAYADSYLGLGAGLMFNLGQLGGTIGNDGLNSRVENASMSGAPRGLTGCSYGLSPGQQAACQTGVPGTQQKLIYPENELISMQHSSNRAFDVKTSGSMTGLVLTAFYEQSIGTFMFVRAGVSYNQKILGGETSASLATIQWYHIKWDYKAIVAPAYFGLKASVGDTAAVYGGGGVNYYRGGWSVGGTNMGSIPTTLLGSPYGAHQARDPVTGVLKGGDLIGERISFQVHGIGFNFLLGLEGKMASGDKLFFEIETILAGDYGVAKANNPSTNDHFAPFPAKITVIAGTTYSFGYKMKL